MSAVKDNSAPDGPQGAMPLDVPMVVALAVIVSGLYVGRDVLIPLAIAILLSFMLSPLVASLQKRNVPRMMAVGFAAGNSHPRAGSLPPVVITEEVGGATHPPDHQHRLHVENRRV